MKEDSKLKGEHIRNRSIRTDSLLRETSSHYIRQIGDADKKARIMLVVTSVMITIGLTVVTKNVLVIPKGWISAVFLISANLVTLVFSILSIKPTLKDEVSRVTEKNILHYKTCTQHALPDYAKKLIETLEDDEKKTDAIIQELYYYGNLLNKKYKNIEYAYLTFLWGLVSTLVSYLIIYMLHKFL